MHRVCLVILFCVFVSANSVSAAPIEGEQSRVLGASVNVALEGLRDLWSDFARVMNIWDKAGPEFDPSGAPEQGEVETREEGMLDSLRQTLYAGPAGPEFDPNGISAGPR